MLQVIGKSESALNHLSNETASILCVMLEFLIEAVQGPCLNNQVILVQSPVVDVCKRILAAKFKAQAKHQFAVSFFFS